MRMKMIDFRGIFQREWLTDLFLNNTGAYFEAIYEDEVEDLIKYVWYEMIKAYNREPSNYPLELTVNTYEYDDNTAFSIIEMPELPKSNGRNLAIYAMVIFDTNNKKPPRFFVGETDYNGLGLSICAPSGRLIFVVEYAFDDNMFQRQNFGMLLSGGERVQAVEPEEELLAFIQRVVDIYQKEN